MTISQSEVRPAKFVNSSHNLASSSSRRRFSSSSWLSRDLRSGVRSPEGSDCSDVSPSWRLVSCEEVDVEAEEEAEVEAEEEAEVEAVAAAAAAATSSSSRRCFSRSSSRRATSSSTALAIYKFNLF